MRKILLIARRDYLAAVRTKAFLIGLLIAPLLFGGSFLATVFVKGQPGNEVRRIAVVDHTGKAAAAIAQQVERQDRSDGFDKRTGMRVMPKYELQIVTPDLRNPDAQLLALSNRVRNKQLFAFFDIGATEVNWYSNESGFGNVQRWFAGPVNDGFRMVRLKTLGLNGQQVDQALNPVQIESMNLVARNPKTGKIVPARKRGLAEGFAAPFILAILFFILFFSPRPQCSPVSPKIKRSACLKCCLPQPVPSTSSPVRYLPQSQLP